MERRKEAGRRLQDQAAKTRAEKVLLSRTDIVVGLSICSTCYVKLAQKEEDLKFLQSIKAWKEKESKADFAVGPRSLLSYHLFANSPTIRLVSVRKVSNRTLFLTPMSRRSKLLSNVLVKRTMLWMMNLS